MTCDVDGTEVNRRFNSRVGFHGDGAFALYYLLIMCGRGGVDSCNMWRQRKWTVDSTAVLVSTATARSPCTISSSWVVEEGSMVVTCDVDGWLTVLGWDTFSMLLSVFDKGVTWARGLPVIMVVKPHGGGSVRWCIRTEEARWRHWTIQKGNYATVVWIQNTKYIYV